jgi:hypothetical protein
VRKFGSVVVAATLTGALCLGGMGLSVGAASVKPAVTCTPGYRPCIPLKRSDVDCYGGSGNGPRYTKPGVVYKVKRGYDRYGLDADRDGKGCE